ASLFTRDDATIRRAFECMRGFAPEAIVTSILFSYMGYFNGHSKSLFVMVQGMIQSFAIRLPMAYIMSALPNASLTGIALAGPAATVVGILLCTLYFLRLKRKLVFTD
ncbi:MAG: MATE family efflux transporter, partial [Spirochaetales bacterium]|nr:MATE family efflux transporter [Spirochaetales bacterium]